MTDDSAYHAPYYLWAAIEPFAYFGALALFIRFLLLPLDRGSKLLAQRLAEQGKNLSALPVLRVVPSLGNRLWRGDGWGAAMLFTWAFLLFWHLAFWPVVIYLGYFHEHRFGMWHASFPRFIWEGAKAGAIGAFSLSFLVFGLYGLARRVERWWLILGVPAAALLWVAGAVDPFRGLVHHDQHPLASGPLRERLEALLDRANVEFKDLLVETRSDVSRSVQAYFAGQGPTRRIVLTDSMLSQMAPDEIEAVVAHEAAHVHELRWPGRVSSSIAIVALLYGVERLFRLAAARRWLGIQSRADVRSLPLVVGLFSAANFIADPVAGYFARGRELAADRYALNLTHDPAAFERMLVKAGQLNRLDPNPPAFVIWMGSSHPSLGERLLAVRAFEKEHPEMAKH